MYLRIILFRIEFQKLIGFKTKLVYCQQIFVIQPYTALMAGVLPLCYGLRSSGVCTLHQVFYCVSHHPFNQILINSLQGMPAIVYLFNFVNYVGSASYLRSLLSLLQ